MSGGGKGGKAPTAPDYMALAAKQGDINADAARLGTTLSRVDQSSPYGSVSYEQDPNNPDKWTQNTTLSPEQQKLFDSNQSNQIGASGAAADQLGQIANRGSLDFSGQPSQVTNVAQSQFKTDVSAPGTATSNLDFSGVASLPGANDFGAERQRVEDAMYGRATANLDPQFQQREDAERTRLINSGNTEGSEAWKNEMGNFERERQNAYTGARDSAILAGGNEQSRLMADALRARQQGVGEVTAAGQFSNQAAQQALQAELAKTGLYNAAQSDQFAQGQTNAALQNQGRAAGINEQLTKYNQPLHDFMSLYGNGASNVPNSSVGSAQSVSPYDLMGAANQNYQTQIDAYNAKQAGNSGMFGSLLNLAGNLGSSYISKSDERLKEDIEAVGELPQGVGVYEYSFKGDPSRTRHTGVMAQELERVQPDAVLMGQDGYRRVNYSKVLARALRDTA